MWYQDYDKDGVSCPEGQWVTIDTAKRDQYGVHYWIRCWHSLTVRYTTDAGTYIDIPIQLSTDGHTSDGDDYTEGTIPPTYSPIPIPAKWENVP